MDLLQNRGCYICEAVEVLVSAGTDGSIHRGVHRSLLSELAVKQTSVVFLLLEGEGGSVLRGETPEAEQG